ncbi:MAG: type VI secretion system-associated protein TagF [Gammaproteobacteria bacterium]|nr:type VI secretion system-associated protein TagF [Gammaproteobacteria bacterium]
MSESSTLGYYGKVPIVGDFVSRRLPRRFIDPWDRWLQAALTASRNQLAEDWQKSYLISPMWRFVLAPGICDSQLWLGILMPSVDKVGRHFPLTLAKSVPVGGNLFSLLVKENKLDDWFDQAEEVMLSMLEDQQLSLETFDSRVMDLPTFFADADADMQGSDHEHYTGTLLSNNTWRIRLESVTAVSHGYPLLLHLLISGRTSAYSLWWSDGAEFVEPSLLLCEGLPPIQGFAAMLNGEWRRWGLKECHD